MVISGMWGLCDDGVLRPIVLAEVRTPQDEWLQIACLVDSGADRTVFTADVLRFWGNSTSAGQDLAGVGGAVTSVTLHTQIRMKRETGATILIDGPFAAFTDPKSLDMSVLGRDVTNLFAVVTDRPQDVVCLLGGNHRYQIIEK